MFSWKHTHSILRQKLSSVLLFYWYPTVERTFENVEHVETVRELRASQTYSFYPFCMSVSVFATAWWCAYMLCLNAQISIQLFERAHIRSLLYRAWQTNTHIVKHAACN